MSDTQLYPTEVPGWYWREFGGCVVQMDLNRRVVELWISTTQSEDADFDQAEAALSALGITGFHRAWEVEPGLIAAEADF